jgi:hypothetical protein
MKKTILFILCAFLFTATTYAQQYKQSDIGGIWLVTEAFNENTKQWVPCGGDDAQAYAFMSVTSHGKPLALLSNKCGVSTFVYTLNNNKVLLRDIDDDTFVIVTIKIVSLKRGHCFVGLVSTYNSQYSAKFKFTKIDEKE